MDGGGGMSMRWAHVVDVATAGTGGWGREGKDSLYTSGGQSLDIFLLGFLKDALGAAQLASTAGGLVRPGRAGGRADGTGGETGKRGCGARRQWAGRGD